MHDVFIEEAVTNEGVFLHGLEARGTLLVEEVDGSDGASGVVEEEVNAEDSTFAFGAIEVPGSRSRSASV
jgi:hypothetical protein